MLPVLILNPRSDREFVARAGALLEEGDHTPASFQERLREDYPDAVVRPRELSSERALVWYVYRDGRWIPGMSVAQEGEDGRAR